MHTPLFIGFIAVVFHRSIRTVNAAQKYALNRFLWVMNQNDGVGISTVADVVPIWTMDVRCGG